MTTHNPLSVLSDLPLPLAPPDPVGRSAPHSAGGTGALEASAVDLHPGSGLNAGDSSELLGRPPEPEQSHQDASAHLPVRLQDSLFTAHKVGLTGQAWRSYIRDQALVPMMMGVYREEKVPDSPLLRAFCLAELTPPDYLYRIRFSRKTAAWVLGYISDPPDHRLDVDYDKTNRTNLPRAYRARFATHQSSFYPFDSAALGPITVTTPLRTALDLLLYYEDVEAIQAVRSILLGTANSVTPEIFRAYATHTNNLPSQIHDRAMYLAQEAELTLSERGSRRG